MTVNSVANACNNYFNFPEEIRNWKTNSWTTNGLAVLKIISLATVLVPLGFFIARSICLKGRVTKNPTGQEVEKAAAVAEKTLPVDTTKTTQEAYKHLQELLEKGDYDGATAFADSTTGYPQTTMKESILYHLAKNGQLERALLSYSGREHLLGPFARTLARSGYIKEAIDTVKKMPEGPFQRNIDEKFSVIGTICRRMMGQHPLHDSFIEYVEEREKKLAAALDKKFDDTLAQVMDLVQKSDFKEAISLTYSLGGQPEKRWLALKAIAVAVAKNENAEFPKTWALDIATDIANEKEIRAAFCEIIEIFQKDNSLTTALEHFNIVTSIYPQGTFGNGQLRENTVNHFSVALAQNGQLTQAHEQLKRIPVKKHSGISNKATADLSREFTKKGATEQAQKLTEDISDSKMQQEARKYICWSLLKTHQVDKCIDLIASLPEESTRDPIRVELSKKIAKRGKFPNARMLANTITQPQLKDDTLKYINKKESR